MKTTKMLTTTLVFFVSIFMILGFNSAVVNAANISTVTPLINGTDVEFIGQADELSNESITILIFDKETNSIKFVDQSNLVNGEFKISTNLPIGNYAGYANTSTGEKISISDFEIIETIAPPTEDVPGDKPNDTPENGDTPSDTPENGDTPSTDKPSTDIKPDGSINTPTTENGSNNNNGNQNNSNLPNTGARFSSTSIIIFATCLIIAGLSIFLFNKNKKSVK